MLVYRYESEKIKDAKAVFETFRKKARSLDKVILNEVKTQKSGITAGETLVPKAPKDDDSDRSDASHKAAQNTVKILRGMTMSQALRDNK